MSWKRTAGPPRMAATWLFLSSLTFLTCLVQELTCLSKERIVPRKQGSRTYLWPKHFNVVSHGFTTGCAWGGGSSLKIEVHVPTKHYCWTGIWNTQLPNATRPSAMSTKATGPDPRMWRRPERPCVPQCEGEFSHRQQKKLVTIGIGT